MILTFDDSYPCFFRLCYNVTNDITGEVLMDKKILKYVGYDLYNVKKLKGRKRYLVFRMRCHLHKGQIGDLLSFFAATPLRKAMLEHTTSFVEQTTRAFFIKILPGMSVLLL